MRLSLDNLVILYNIVKILYLLFYKTLYIYIYIYIDTHTKIKKLYIDEGIINKNRKFTKNIIFFLCINVSFNIF
jgi:hypothetical protein